MASNGNRFRIGYYISKKKQGQIKWDEFQLLAGSTVLTLPPRSHWTLLTFDISCRKSNVELVAVDDKNVATVGPLNALVLRLTDELANSGLVENRALLAAFEQYISSNPHVKIV